MLKVAIVLLAGCYVGPTSSVQSAQEDFFRRICTDSQYAYEHGYNKAQQAEPMETRWSERCVPEVRRERVDAYVAGYQAAAGPRGNAGGIGLDLHLNANVQTGGGGTTACAFDADCGVGRACRAIRGGKVCMGEGAMGDYCDFDGDCLSQSCAVADGGVKYCR